VLDSWIGQVLPVLVALHGHNYRSAQASDHDMGLAETVKGAGNDCSFEQEEIVMSAEIEIFDRTIAWLDKVLEWCERELEWCQMAATEDMMAKDSHSGCDFAMMGRKGRLDCDSACLG
jgi:hypothetical protein